VLTVSANIPSSLPQVLRRTKGAFELVDVSDHLPLLRRLPGKQRWRVKDRDNWYDSWEEGKKVRRGGGGAEVAGLCAEMHGVLAGWQGWSGCTVRRMDFGATPRSAPSCAPSA